jgi:hypothetical protein
MRPPSSGGGDYRRKGEGLGGLIRDPAPLILAPVETEPLDEDHERDADGHDEEGHAQ